MKGIINLLVFAIIGIGVFVAGYTCGEEKGREDAIEIVRPTMVKTIDELRVLKSHNEWTEDALSRRSKQYDDLKVQYDSLKEEIKEREDEKQEINFIRHHAAWLDYVTTQYVNAYGDEILEDSFDKYDEIETINFVE